MGRRLLGTSNYSSFIRITWGNKASISLPTDCALTNVAINVIPTLETKHTEWAQTKQHVHLLNIYFCWYAMQEQLRGKSCHTVHACTQWRDVSCFQNSFSLRHESKTNRVFFLYLVGRHTVQDVSKSFFVLSTVDRATVEMVLLWLTWLLCHPGRLSTLKKVFVIMVYGLCFPNVPLHAWLFTFSCKGKSGMMLLYCCTCLRCQSTPLHDPVEWSNSCRNPRQNHIPTHHL